MSTQPEQVLENQLVAQLSNIGYTKVSVPDEAALLANLKTQLEKHNNIIFTDKEFERVLNILSKGSVFEKAKTISNKKNNFVFVVGILPQCELCSISIHIQAGETEVTDRMSFLSHDEEYLIIVEHIRKTNI